MAWVIPNDIEKEIEFEEIEDDILDYYHAQMHVFWKKLEDGYNLGWSFAEIFLMHKKILIEMLAREITHIEPINNLDMLPIARDNLELIKLINQLKVINESKAEVEEEIQVDDLI